MRILVCNWKDLAHPQSGGAEVWTHGVASAWAAEGHEVTLACSTAPGLAAFDERDGVEIRRGGGYRWTVGAHARDVYEACDGKFDLVVDEINTRPFFAPRWARNSNVIAFVHQVAREIWFHETPLAVALAGRFVFEPRWLRVYRDSVVCTPSQSTVASLRGYGIHHAVALPQGSELTWAPPVNRAADPTFVFVGRLCAMKRPLDAIRAYRLVQQQVPSARLQIIGDGPQAARVARQAGNGVELLGVVSAAERNARVGAAHALVATSVREGWGLVVSEAAACGTGTIGYAVPGLVDSIRATGGVLVAPNAEALATEMLRVARSPERAPKPLGTGTVTFAEVADALLAEAEGRERA